MTHPVAQLLQNSQLSFYLGGSRAMATRTPEDPQEKRVVIKDSTDWDFYCQNTPDHQQFLIEAGFKMSLYCRVVLGVKDTNTMTTEARQEVDSETESEYTLDDMAELIYEKGDVQVVLRSDALLYKTIFETITPEFFYDYLWKSAPETIVTREQIKQNFNQLFAIAQAVRSSH